MIEVCITNGVAIVQKCCNTWNWLHASLPFDCLLGGKGYYLIEFEFDVFMVICRQNSTSCEDIPLKP